MRTNKITKESTASVSLLLKAGYEAFPERMAVLAELAGNAYQLALKSGQSASGVRTYFSGAEPTRPVLIKLANAGGVLVSWLVNGTGPIRDIAPKIRVGMVERYLDYCRQHESKDEHETQVTFVKAYNIGAVAQQAELALLTVYELRQWLNEYLNSATFSEDFIRIPFYDLDVVDEDLFSASSRAAAQKAALFCLRRDLVVETWKLPPEKIGMFAVRTDEMYPILRPGDWVLCDCRQQRLQRNGIYLIRRDGELVFRRVQIINDKRVRLMRETRAPDDDRAFKNEVVEYAIKEISFIGRVMLRTNRVRL